MVNLLIIGGSGLVGRNALEHALGGARVTSIIAPTRSPLASHPKLTNPVARDFETLFPDVVTWPVTAVLCAVGTTIGKAGSKEAFRHVDYELPLTFARSTYAQGARTFALVSAIGASSSSRFFFARIKGELERDMASVGFKSLTIARPSIIGGKRNEFRLGESFALGLARFLRPVLPRRFHVNPAAKIAEVLLEAVIQGTAGIRMVYSNELI